MRSVAAFVFPAILALVLATGMPPVAAAQYDSCDHYGPNLECLDKNGNVITSAATQPTAQNTPAQGSINITYLKGYTDSIQGIINQLLVPVIVAIAFLFFVWGAFKYFIKGADSPTERATGQQFILWSVIGFVAIFTVWGLVNLVGTTLGLDTRYGAPPTPKI